MSEGKPVSEERLDQLLRQYSEVDPAPGLEDRVIAVVLSEKSRIRNRRTRWRAAGLAAALLFPLLYLQLSIQNEVPREERSAEETTQVASLDSARGNALEELRIPQMEGEALIVPEIISLPVVTESEVVPEPPLTPGSREASTQPSVMKLEQPELPAEETESLVKSLSIQNVAISELAVSPLEDLVDPSPSVAGPVRQVGGDR